MKSVFVAVAVAASMMVMAPTIQNDPDGAIPWWQELAALLHWG